jgi:hypothetical protein
MQELTRPGAPGYDPRAVGAVTLGAPIYVKGSNEPLHDIWLIPVLSGPDVVGAFSAPVLRDGKAVAGSYSGFVGTFPHPLALAEAIAKGSISGDPAVSAELAWTTLGSRQGIANGQQHPFWRVARSSGATVLVFSDGTVMAAQDLH